MTERRRNFYVCAGLVGLVVALYSHVFQCDYIDFDDDSHVFANPLVTGGLTWRAVVAAFTQFHASQWIPLTWISHMLDVTIFGLDPAGPHLENVGWHALNSCLVLAAFRTLTQQFWPSAAVALLFAVHPINVESVAWVAERKNVLSTTFWLLAMITYARYAEDRRPRWMALTAACMALGLLAKPMLVTLPCALLLIDAWPLCRHESTAWWRLALEKWPLFLLSAATSISTVLAARFSGTLADSGALLLSERLSNAITGYPRYLANLFWPTKLAVLYPLTSAAPPIILALAAGLLLAITAGCWLARGRMPWLLVGWLWFLGLLVPVSSVFQVGSQALADRFAYLPELGAFVGLVWTVQALLVGRAAPWRPILTGATAAALAVLTLAQVERWTDTTTLFEHTLRVTRGNAVSFAIAGRARAKRGEWPEALAHYRRAIPLMPENGDIRMLYGEALAQSGDRTTAIAELRQAVALDPDNGRARHQLAALLERAGAEKPAAP